MSGDVEALARVVTAQMKGNRWADLTPLAIARAVLASDWLAADRARVRAETLAEAGEAVATVETERHPSMLGWEHAIQRAVRVLRDMTTEATR